MKKIAKFELGHQKKLDECSSILELFLVKYGLISILLANVVFSNLTKNNWNFLKLKKIK